MKRNLCLTGIIITLFLYSCAPKPYATTNKQYKKQAKELAKKITAIPKDSLLADSMKLPAYWVGTINFGLRKPNAVIIHHTAQKRS
jgi:N-acetylmuramoyl-L-alanine amidase